MFDGKYVVVGSVVDGRWLVDEIAVMEDSHGKPSRKVQIVRTAVEIAEADHNN
jgi:cyclophilin family peptidyl-prolyl cis-trans isomerase